MSSQRSAPILRGAIFRRVARSGGEYTPWQAADDLLALGPGLGVRFRRGGFGLGSRLPWLLPVVLVLAAGCGRQDRLVPVSPAQPTPLESQPWGVLVDEEAVHLQSGAPDSFAGWSATDFESNKAPHNDILA